MMNTIHCDVIVRKAPKSKEDLDNLSPFDAKAWCCLCERACQHTLLVNEIIEQISKQIKQERTLIDWIRKQAVQGLETQTSTTSKPGTKQGESWFPQGLVEELCGELEDLKQISQFQEISGRVRTAAINRVKEIFKSWFATHQKLIRQIKGKQRWLAVVKSDAELAKNSDFSQLDIEHRAEQILTQIEAENESTGNKRRLFSILFDEFDATNDVLERRAIIHLLKNSGKVRLEPKKPRKRKNPKHSAEPMTLEERLAAKQVEIERLEKRLLSQLPRARNLFPEQAFEEALADLVALPDPDSAKHDRYYLLGFSLLIHQSSSDQYVQFEQYLLRAMQRNWEGMDSLFYYRVLSFSFLLYATSTQKYLQLGSYLLRAIKIEAERVEAQFEDWQESITFKLSEFLKEPKSLPYPIRFGCNDVRGWQTNEAGKIFFKLNGWADLIFEVRCNRRQLPLIKTFLKDWQTKEQSKGKGKGKDGNQYSESFMLLGSIELVWKPTGTEKQNTQPCSECESFRHYPGKGFWNECKLSMHWTYDSDLLTQQGMEKVRQQKLEPQLESLKKKQEELEEKQTRLTCLEEVPETSRSKAQTKRIENLKRAIEKLQSDLAKPRPKLDCLQNSPVLNRPDRPAYEGRPHIVVGVLLDLDKYLVAVVVDVERGKILEKRKACTISAEGYKLRQKYLLQRPKHSKQRQIDQKAHRHIRQTESELGQQIVHVFARDLVKLAQKHQASTIVIPETEGWRDRLYSQLVARAEIKCKGVKKAMARYTKAQGERLHEWNYNQLSEAIIRRAETDGLKVILQRTEFEEDVYQQAEHLAIAAYDSLNSTET